MTNIFETASRTKLRFPIEGSGELTTEQLWRLGYDKLVEYEDHLRKSVQPWESRRAQKGNDVEKLRLDIVSHILDVLDEEKKANTEKMAAETAKQERLAMVEAAIRQKELAEIAQMSREELIELRNAVAAK